MGWWLGLAPDTLEFWVRFPNERNQGKQAHPVLKYRVPHGSQPRPGWAPDWDQIPCQPGGWILHQPPGVLGSFPNERNQNQGKHAPCVKVPGSSRVPAQFCNRSCSNKTHTSIASELRDMNSFFFGFWCTAMSQYLLKRCGIANHGTFILFL